MTARQCHERTGQSLQICEAFVKAGLRLSEVSPYHVTSLRGFTQKEHKALDDHYRTKLESQECDPMCVICHPELYDRSSHDGRKH